jgi:hypothetical protein
MNRTVAASEQSTQPIDVRIRTACLDDAARIAELAAQLGYAVTPDDMRSRLETVLGDGHQLVSVAENQHSEIIGWLPSDYRSSVASRARSQYCRAGGRPPIPVPRNRPPFDV